MCAQLSVHGPVSMGRQCAGATVMPHNIILHSSLIQTRNYPRTTAGKRMAVRVRPAPVGSSRLWEFRVLGFHASARACGQW